MQGFNDTSITLWYAIVLVVVLLIISYHVLFEQTRVANSFSTRSIDRVTIQQVDEALDVTVDVLDAYIDKIKPDLISFIQHGTSCADLDAYLRRTQADLEAFTAHVSAEERAAAQQKNEMQLTSACSHNPEKAETLMLISILTNLDLISGMIADKHIPDRILHLTNLQHMHVQLYMSCSDGETKTYHVEKLNSECNNTANYQDSQELQDSLQSHLDFIKSSARSAHANRHRSASSRNSVHESRDTIGSTPTVRSVQAAVPVHSCAAKNSAKLRSDRESYSGDKETQLNRRQLPNNWRVAERGSILKLKETRNAQALGSSSLGILQSSKYKPVLKDSIQPSQREMVKNQRGSLVRDYDYLDN